VDRVRGEMARQVGPAPSPRPRPGTRPRYRAAPGSAFNCAARALLCLSVVAGVLVSATTTPVTSQSRIPPIVFTLLQPKTLKIWPVGVEYSATWTISGGEGPPYTKVLAGGPIPPCSEPSGLALYIIKSGTVAEISGVATHAGQTQGLCLEAYDWRGNVSPPQLPQILLQDGIREEMGPDPTWGPPVYDFSDHCCHIATLVWPEHAIDTGEPYGLVCVYAEGAYQGGGMLTNPGPDLPPWPQGLGITVYTIDSISAGEHRFTGDFIPVSGTVSPSSVACHKLWDADLANGSYPWRAFGLTVIVDVLTASTRADLFESGTAEPRKPAQFTVSIATNSNGPPQPGTTAQLLSNGKVVAQGPVSVVPDTSTSTVTLSAPPAKGCAVYSARYLGDENELPSSSFPTFVPPQPVTSANTPSRLSPQVSSLLEEVKDDLQAALAPLQQLGADAGEPATPARAQAGAAAAAALKSTATKGSVSSEEAYGEGCGSSAGPELGTVTEDTVTDTKMQMTVADDFEASPSEYSPELGSDAKAAETELNQALQYLDQVM